MLLDLFLILHHNFDFVNQLESIKQPIVEDLRRFSEIFDETLTHANPLLSSVFQHIRSKKGKQMRPVLLFLVAHEFGIPTDATYRSAVMLELLHTASLVHDDIVDESNERRGQASVNALFDNKVAVLIGDFLLSACLEKAAQTGNIRIVQHIANLGKMLAFGEIQQISNKEQSEFSTQPYFDVIKLKTASLFTATAEVAAISVGASDEDISRMSLLGENLGMCFQIKDDIFDYFDNSEVGKPTGNDMNEGKLTLPVLLVLNEHPTDEMCTLARKVRKGEATQNEINTLVSYTKNKGGVEAADKIMRNYAQEALKQIELFDNKVIKESLKSYVDFVINRSL